MQRYFLDLHECGTVTRDTEGVLRASLEVVHVEAIEAARAVMCAELSAGKLCLSCHIEIRDAAGESLMTVRFRDAVRLSGLSITDAL